MEDISPPCIPSCGSPGACLQSPAFAVSQGRVFWWQLKGCSDSEYPTSTPEGLCGALELLCSCQLLWADHTAPVPQQALGLVLLTVKHGHSLQKSSLSLVQLCQACPLSSPRELWEEFPFLPLVIAASCPVRVQLSGEFGFILCRTARRWWRQQLHAPLHTWLISAGSLSVISCWSSPWWTWEAHL